MRKVSDKLHVGSQVSPGDIGQLKSEGFAAIINNRPDGEEAGQPTAAENGRAAEAAGLAHIHLPVVSGNIGEEQVRAFQRAVAEARGPVLAHCRSGLRSLTLHVIGEVLDGRMKKEDVIPYGHRLGFDLAGAVRWLEARGH